LEKPVSCHVTLDQIMGNRNKKDGMANLSFLEATKKIPMRTSSQTIALSVGQCKQLSQEAVYFGDTSSECNVKFSAD